MKLANNALAGFLLDYFTTNRSQIEEYLIKVNEIRSLDLSKNEYDAAMNDLENNFPTSGMLSYLQVRLVNFVNTRPLLALVLGAALTYNIVFYSVRLIAVSLTK